MTTGKTENRVLSTIDLFAGVGGFSLAGWWMGWHPLAWCEINSFCQQVLKYHFPHADAITDITTADFKKYRGKCHVITGGFPCQPFSTAGEQRGGGDERYLWPHMLRAIREVQPEWVVGENVYGITSKKFELVFEEICSSLEAEGYEVQPVIIPASAIGAEHERERVWFIAHAERFRLPGQGSLLGPMQPTKIGDRETSRFIDYVQREAMPYVCGEHDGISRELDEGALHAYGNAVVPQLAYEIFSAIEQYMLIDNRA